MTEPQKWDGVDRRKRPRKRWQIGIARSMSVGEVVMIIGVIFGAGGMIVEIRNGLAANAAAIEEIRCEMKIDRAERQGKPPPKCVESIR